MIKIKSLLDLEISKKGCYELKKPEELGKDDIIPIVSDVMFKIMLGNESKKKYVCYFLSLILEKDYQEIYDNITFVKNDIDNDNYHKPNKIVDLIVKINGVIYNIEMNNNSERTYIERNIEYAMELYKSKRKRGDNKYKYSYVFQINIDNFTFKDRKKTSDMFMLRNEKGEILTNKIKIMHLYLPKIKEKYYNKEKLSELEKIILVFNLSNKNELDNIIGDNKIMKEYKKEALDASHDEEVIGLYDKELEDFYNRQAAYYEIEEKAMKEGLEKGIKKGIEQGENKKSIEIAKIMLDKNMDISLISEITKLSKEEIENCN